jgi:hypothetical protein
MKNVQSNLLNLPTVLVERSVYGYYYMASNGSNMSHKMVFEWRLIMDRNEVSTAFEIVMEEVESVVDGFKHEGSAAFQKGDYDSARILRMLEVES